MDYQALLHELAVANWRRALVNRDFGKARDNAERLTQSTERLWKGIGYSILAVTELSRGFRDVALSALEISERFFADLPSMVASQREQAAYVLLESGEPARAVEKATPESLWCGVGLARLGHTEEAEVIADTLAPRSELQTAYLRWELGMGDNASLERALGPLIGDRAAVHQPLMPIRYALARALETEGRGTDALDVYEQIVSIPDGLLHWPVPFVRSHFRRARLYEAAGDAVRAREANLLFLSYWQDGELDPDDVAEAGQRVSS
ncbi:MAG TPA: hypothetical protein VLK65_08700 [Vicinamibacteria bacterium]|nr:hypothetical protein [Vicinamibacteria bacterium]